MDVLSKLKRSWYDKNVEELIKNRERISVISFIYLSVIVFIVALAGFLSFSFGVSGQIGAVFFIYFALFFLIFFFDIRNDINRINLWIYLKQKLEEE